MPSLIGIPGSPRDARCGAVLDNEGPRGGGQGNGGNFAGMAGGYGAGSLGAGADFGSSGAFTGAPAGFGLGGTLAGSTWSGGGASDPTGNYGGGVGGAMAGYNGPNGGVGITSAGGLLGGINQLAGMVQDAYAPAGQTRDFAQRAGSFGLDLTGIGNNGQILGTGMTPAELGRIIGSIGLGMVNPLAGMAFNTMTGLAMGGNPGGMFGGQVGGFGGGQLGSMVGGALGPAGSMIGGILGSQLGSLGGRELGRMAYNSGYSAPASQGPAAQGALGQTQAPQPMPAAPAEFAGLSQPAVTAPVSNPVANPLRALLLALGPRAGINVPLLLGGQPQPQQRQGNSVT